MNIFYTLGYINGHTLKLNKPMKSDTILRDLVKQNISLNNSTEYLKLSFHTQIYLEVLYPNITDSERYEKYIQKKDLT